MEQGFEKGREGGNQVGRSVKVKGVKGSFETNELRKHQRREREVSGRGGGAGRGG